MKMTGNTMKHIMKHIWTLNLVMAWGLMIVAVSWVMAVWPIQAQESPHGTVWQEWQPLAEGFVARRRVPERLELPKEERQSPATQVQDSKRPGAWGRDRLKPGDKELMESAVSVKSSTPWLYTGAPGLYGVNLSDLSIETGISVSKLRDAVKKGRLSLLNQGEPVSWHFDPLRERLLFAAERYETFHAQGNAYQLRQTQKVDSQRMTERRNPRFRETGDQTPFPEVLHFEEETDMMFFLWLDPLNPDARYWFWDYIYGALRPQIQIPLFIPHPADYGTARMRVGLHGFTDLYPGNDHRVIAELNGVAVGSALSWDALKPAELVADFDQALLNPDGDNILTLHSMHDSTRYRPGQLLESITIEYDRLPVSLNGQVWMHSADQGVQEVVGFTGEDILVIESPIRNAVIRRDVAVYQDYDGRWAVAFEAKAGVDYLIAESSAVMTPVLDARGQVDLTASDNAADYLIISPREFSGTAQALAEHRQGDYGFVEVVWLDDIYKSFSAGRADPFAIARFMEYIQTRWSPIPSVVTLVGKGSLDRKNRMGYGDNFLPVLMTANPWQLAPSDARLLGVEDGVASFSIGRLPITNDAEGLAFVDKLAGHELVSGGDAAYRAVIVADNPDDGGNFHGDADRLAAQLQGLGFAPIIKLYHSAGAVRANLTLTETWESGFISYSGHGGAIQLGSNSEKFLHVNDVNLLRNASRPIFMALTCSAGNDSQPGTRSLAGALVLNPEGGAVASLAPAGLSANADAHILGSAFIDYLFGRYSTVGDAMVEATRQTRGQIRDFMAPMYSVIGDPAVYPR